MRIFIALYTHASVCLVVLTIIDRIGLVNMWYLMAICSIIPGLLYLRICQLERFREEHYKNFLKAQEDD